LEASGRVVTRSLEVMEGHARGTVRSVGIGFGSEVTDVEDDVVFVGEGWYIVLVPEIVVIMVVPFVLIAGVFIAGTGLFEALKLGQE
jgi:hypothetical protein